MDEPEGQAEVQPSRDAREDFQACSRNACGEPATATLNCNYLARRVTLEDLQPGTEPDHFHLCAAHLSRFRAPVGWQIEDSRSPASPLEIVIQPASA